ncbi:MAG: FHA domain-containing protein [Sandaracinaceae bacterium]
MNWFKRMFGPRHRAARAAEGAGQWRQAASLWAEAGEKDRAADALLHLARRGGDLEDRLDAFYDALRWIPEDDEERHEEVEREMGLAVLEDARARGVASAEEKRRLADAASRLERLDRPGYAAEAYRMLDRKEDQARCLEAAGDIEGLEALLDQTSAVDEQAEALSRLLSEYEMALAYGARLEARDALRKASGIAPHDRSVGELLRRFEARLPPTGRVSLSIGGQSVTFVGTLPAVIGRGGEGVDVPIRGTSVSRRHAEVARVESGLVLRDLDSRNGTLVRGLPIRGEIELSGDTEVGLGDDVSIKLSPNGAALAIEVLNGFLRGQRIVVGTDALRFDGLPASVSFVSGWAVLTADAGQDLSLSGKVCALPVHLLTDDRIEVGGVPVEVLP